ncbi:MAG: ATP-binding protein, partial [Candidatus Marinimicrobia bacterium]|nr:ATP-binding protein [Candidatus Neomarinimicrobiota bacterium]
LALDDDSEIPGQGEQIKQVLLNLMLNAIQAMPDGGLIEVSSKNFQHEVHIKVSDNGPGIAPEDRERIFNPFVTTRDSGTGLGLAITQRIVHAHEGHIVLDSISGKGASFTVCLPLPFITTKENPTS